MEQEQRRKVEGMGDKAGEKRRERDGGVGAKNSSGLEWLFDKEGDTCTHRENRFTILHTSKC